MAQQGDASLSAFTHDFEQRIVGVTFTVPACTLNFIRARLSESSTPNDHQVRAAIYSGNTLVAVSSIRQDISTTPGEYDFGLSQVLSAGTYNFCILGNNAAGSIGIGGDFSGSTGFVTDDNVFGAPTFPDPADLTAAGSTRYAILIDYTEGAVPPSITSIDGDDGVYNGQTGAVIAGADFGATQGAGRVVISPTDDIDDVDAEEQTVTSWGASSISITVVRGDLDLDTTLYLFVETNGGDSNAAGHEMEIQARPYIRETLIDLNGAAVASVTGITMMVWRNITQPTTGAPNPNQALTVATNGSGQIDQVIDRGTLDLGDPVWVALFKDGTPARGTLRKVTPVYE